MATALITGASAGLGIDFARILAGQKYDIILTARNEEKLKTLASELSAAHGVKCHTIAADLAKPGSAASLARQIRERGLKIDILVNNAGCGLWGAFAESDLASMAGMIQLNVNSLTELTREFLPEMVARKQGRVLNVASTAAFQPGPWMAVYYATKAYVLSFGEALATELRGTGVTVTTLCPGPTRTEFFERAKMGQSRLKSMIFADSMSCAKTGIDSMHQGRVVVVDGLLNWVFSQTARLLPRSTTRSITGAINAASKG
jgi:short-subunit dehydrogenase